MTLIDHPARFAPSRFRYSLCRLTAYLFGRRCAAQASPSQEVALAFNREQSALENNGISILYYVITLALAVAWLAPSSPLRALLILPLLAFPPALWTLVLFTVRGAWYLLRVLRLAPPIPSSRIQCFTHHLVLSSLCLVALLRGNVAARMVASLWFSLLLANVLCWLALRMLRRQVQEVDEALRRCVVT